MLCGLDDPSTLNAHHIKPFSEAQAHRREDMVILCANCHAKADRGEISKDELYAAKRSAAKVVPLHLRQVHHQIAPLAQTVIGDANIVAGGNVTIHTPRAKSKPHSPVLPGTVATDPHKVGYLKYLARRFQKFKEHEVGKEGMRPALIYVGYQREIGFSIEQTPLDIFEKACRYLHRRIENTRLGRILNGRQKLCSTFEEFVQKKGQPEDG